MPPSQYGLHDQSPARRSRAHHDVEIVAYELWEKAGRPEGMRSGAESWQDYFWHQAENQLSGEENFLAAVTGGTPFGETT